MKQITIFIISLLVLTSCSIPQEEGSIEVFFCPQDDCEEVLISFIDENTVCTFYDLDLKNLTEHLVLMNTQVLLFEDNFEKFGNNFYEVRSRALMHNKFCITNNSVITGSMNPTNNGAYKNNNNLVIINSPTITQNYRDEFLELQTRQERKVKNPVVELLVENRSLIVENYFCPEDDCEKEVLEELTKARQSIHFLTFSFTSDPIGNLLMQKHDAGIEIMGVFEKRQQNPYSEYQRLQAAGVEVYFDNNPQSMHHKVFIIDANTENATIITGSYNPSKNGNERNDENILIIHDEIIAREFLAEFERIETTIKK